MPKKIIFLVIGLVILVVAAVILTNKKEEETLADLEMVEEEIIEPKEEKPTQVVVDIKGEVNSPGVYEMLSEDRVIDVITKAGGLKETADTTLINLSKKVSDAMVIIVYSKDDVKEREEQNEPKVIEDLSNDALIEERSDERSSTTSLVNINEATLEELQTLSGIGEAKARSIIEYRNQNGPFKALEDLMEISGIGEAIFAKIKENITT